jgi:phage terminase large subunit-like protein
MTEPLSLLLTYAKTDMITIEHNPALNWMSQNIEIQYDNYGNMKPDKSNPVKKIDGIASLINTIYAMIPYIQEPDLENDIIWV